MIRAGQRAALVLAVIAMAAGAVIDAMPAAGMSPGRDDTYNAAPFQPVTLDVIRDFRVRATVSPRVAPRPAPAPAPDITTIAPPRAPVRPSGAPTVAETKAWALDRLGQTQYACLVEIVSHEDGTWDPYRTNASSGAYGIPQALPGSKMATAGDDWRWNRITQVRWMLGYLAARYGSPCDGWAFWQAHRWY